MTVKVKSTKKLTHIRLTVDVVFDRNTTNRDTLMDNLRWVAEHAAQNGAFTGDSDAEVQKWSCEAVDVWRV